MIFLIESFLKMKLEVKVLGTGCPKCKVLFKQVNEVILENNIEASLTKVEDIMEIMTFDVMTTPALVINDVVVLKGVVPSKSEILDMLRNGNNHTNKSNDSCCCS